MKKLARYTASGLLLLVASVAAQAQTQEYLPSKDHKEEWLEFLTDIAKLENASLFIDVDSRKFVPDPRFKERGGLETLERLSTLMSRGMQEFEGTYVLYRWMDANDLRSWPTHTLALSWLQGCSASERQALLSGAGLLFSNIDESERKAMTQVVRKLSGGNGDRMFADHASELRLAVGFTPDIEFTDPASGKTVRLAATHSYPELDPLDGSASSVASGRSGFRPVARPGGGDLNLGQGQMLTLAELYKLGSEKWELKFRYDARLAETSYFLSGRFTRERFMKCLEIATRTVETKEAVDPYASMSDTVIAGLLREIFEDGSESVDGTELSIGDFMSGGQATLFEIYGPNPGLSVMSMLDRYGLSMDSRVSLKSGMALSFIAPGMTQLPNAPDGTKQFVANRFGLSYRGN